MDKEKQELEQPDLSAFTSDMQAEITAATANLAKPEAGSGDEKVKVGLPVGAPGAERATEEIEAETATAETAEKEQEEEEEFIPLVGKTGKAPKLDGVKIENFETLTQLFGEVGIKLEKAEDFTSAIGEIKSLRSRSEELDAQNKTLQDYKSVFETLPPDLFAVVESYLNDEDYRKQMVTVSGSFIDFTRKFEDNKINNLVEYYFPGKFTAEEYEDLVDTKEFKLLETTIRSKFENDKSTLTQKRTDYLNLQTNAKKEYTASVGKSVEQLEKSQLLDAASLKQVQSVLNAGVNGILGLFIDKNGNITQDGAEKLALALHGKSTIARLVERAGKKATSIANEDILGRGAGTGKLPKGKIPEQNVDEKVKDFNDRVIPKGPGNRF